MSSSTQPAHPDPHAVQGNVVGFNKDHQRFVFLIRGRIGRTQLPRCTGAGTRHGLGGPALQRIVQRDPPPGRRPGHRRIELGESRAHLSQPRSSCSAGHSRFSRFVQVRNGRTVRRHRRQRRFRAGHLGRAVQPADRCRRHFGLRHARGSRCGIRPPSGEDTAARRCRAKPLWGAKTGFTLQEFTILQAEREF